MYFLGILGTASYFDECKRGAWDGGSGGFSISFVTRARVLFKVLS